MLPLELDEAVELVKKLPFDEPIKEKFCNDLLNGSFEKHKSFLSNPLLLSIMLLTYGENAEIPSKLSIFYNQAYEALFQRHDAYKGGYLREKLTTLDIQDFSKVFSLFCLMTYEKRLFKMSRTTCLDFIEKSIDRLNFKTLPEDYLNDLLSAACLMIEDGLDIAFSHRSFQEYFVALEIARSRPEIQQKLIDRYWIYMHTDNVMNLLMEIDQDLVERALILPKLEDFFREIGVKRHVGVTHLLRYIQCYFSEVNVDDTVSFTYNASNSNTKISMNRIIEITVNNYSNFVMPSKWKEKKLISY